MLIDPSVIPKAGAAPSSDPLSPPCPPMGSSSPARIESCYHGIMEWVGLEGTQGWVVGRTCCFSSLGALGVPSGPFPVLHPHGPHDVTRLMPPPFPPPASVSLPCLVPTSLPFLPVGPCFRRSPKLNLKGIWAPGETCGCSGGSCCRGT